MASHHFGDSCTHGRPIPAAGKQHIEAGAHVYHRRNGCGGPLPLSDLQRNQVGEVSNLTSRHRSLARFLALGFTPGSRVRMIQNAGFGPVVVLVRDTHVALGRGEAQGIQVTPMESRSHD